MISLQTKSLKKSAPCAWLQLHSDIENSLRGSGIAQVRELICECHGTVVILRGRVASYYYKQVAQELVRKVDREVTIVNLVIVD